MNRLFWGLFLCLLDYDVTVGTAVFGLLPDFIGYFLMMKGMAELAGENRFFDRGRHLAFVMAVVSAVLYIAHLADPDSMASVVLWTVELVVLVVQLILVRMIIFGVAGLEREHELTMRSELLKSMWLILIVIYPLAHIVSWLPLVGDICGMASVVVGALFLAVFWDSRKAFYQSEK